MKSIHKFHQIDDDFPPKVTYLFDLACRLPCRSGWTQTGPFRVLWCVSRFQLGDHLLHDSRRHSLSTLAAWACRMWLQSLPEPKHNKMHVKYWSNQIAQIPPNYSHSTVLERTVHHLCLSLLPVGSDICHKINICSIKVGTQFANIQNCLKKCLHYEYYLLWTYRCQRSWHSRNQYDVIIMCDSTNQWR